MGFFALVLAAYMVSLFLNLFHFWLHDFYGVRISIFFLPVRNGEATPNASATLYVILIVALQSRRRSRRLTTTELSR